MTAKLYLHKFIASILGMKLYYSGGNLQNIAVSARNYLYKFSKLLRYNVIQ